MSAVGQLGEAIYAVDSAQIEASSRTRAKTRLLYALGSVFSGRDSDASRLALALGSNARAPGPSSFWLAEGGGTVEDCAFANSILVHSTLQDDIPVHTGAIVIPPILAVGEAESSSGADVLAALAIGYEIVVRLGSGSANLGRAIGQRGFRHSWFAVVGAAGSLAYLMGLSAEGIADSLALATTLGVPGTMAWLTTSRRSRQTSERYVQIAANARQAVIAANLAKSGFAGIDSALEGTNGLFDIYTGNPALPEGLVTDFGVVWHLDRVEGKSHPGTVIAPVRIAETMRKRYALDVDDIERVVVLMPPWGSNLGIVDQGPFTNLDQALSSTCFAVAATLVHGFYDFDVASASVGDSRIDRLAQRISFASPTDAAGLCEVELTLSSGQTVLASDVSAPKDALLSGYWEIGVERFHRIARAVPAKRRETIVEAVFTLDEQPDCRGLVGLLVELAR